MQETVRFFLGVTERRCLRDWRKSSNKLTPPLLNTPDEYEAMMKPHRQKGELPLSDFRHGKRTFQKIESTFRLGGLSISAMLEGDKSQASHKKYGFHAGQFISMSR